MSRPTKATDADRIELIMRGCTEVGDKTTKQKQLKYEGFNNDKLNQQDPPTAEILMMLTKDGLKDNHKQKQDLVYGSL